MTEEVLDPQGAPEERAGVRQGSWQGAGRPGHPWGSRLGLRTFPDGSVQSGVGEKLIITMVTIATV